MQIFNEIREFLLEQEITITAKCYLQDRLGILAPERCLRMETVPSNFQRNMPNIGKKPETDLFASRLSNQLPSYYSWKPDPRSFGTDALPQKCHHKRLCTFRPFALIHKVLKNKKGRKCLL